jgi:hypothetical protein
MHYSVHDLGWKGIDDLVSTSKPRGPWCAMCLETCLMLFADKFLASRLLA